MAQLTKYQINSVVSVFSVLAKLSISSAVGAGISQSKWLWYRQGESRRLQDIQLFDDASRGPWGATRLLFSLRARSVEMESHALASADLTRSVGIWHFLALPSWSC